MRIAYPERVAGESPWKSVDVKKPVSHRLVRYKTALYEMVGYRDRFGRWIGYDGQEENFAVHEWMELESSNHDESAEQSPL